MTPCDRPVAFGLGGKFLIVGYVSYGRSFFGVPEIFSDLEFEPWWRILLSKK
jgi:hypothetical protein